MTKKTHSRENLISILKESSQIFKLCSRKAKILSALSWEPSVALEFLKNKGTRLPEPKYSIDKQTLLDILDKLNALAPKLKGEHPVLQWLLRTQESYVLAIKLLMEIETPHFFEVSTLLYGNSNSKLFTGNTTNVELADSITNRLSFCALNDIEESYVTNSAEHFAAALEERAKRYKPAIPFKVEVTDSIAAKVVAGMNRVRIRKDARFSNLDLDALWKHEIESHCLTAHNGAKQENCDFLFSGGPRTTMTQEGLAVFYEVYGHTMSQRRFMTLCYRIHALKMVEDGADFIQIFNWYKDKAESEAEAFYNTQRIFRGAKLTGGGPFTKDGVYLAGLLGVYNFLRVAVKNQNRVLVESLLCGRMALEDVGTIAWLRTHGIINPPHYVPYWLKNWETLLSFFSFTAVFGSVDLSSFQSFFDENYTLADWDLS